MDSIRSISVVSVAQLMVLGAMTPVLAEINEEESEHRRLHGRRSTHIVSHERADYPVIRNWLSTPDTPSTDIASSK